MSAMPPIDPPAVETLTKQLPKLVSPSVRKAMEARDTGPLPLLPLEASVRVGSVPYLNARPLTYALGTSVVEMEPSRLAAELRADRLDVALVPLVEVLEAPEGLYRVANHIAIGSERDVYSVYLNHSVPLARIRTVALDPHSKTSVELVRVILEKFYHLKVTYVSAGEPADAQLLIGDPAIAYRKAHPEQKYLDLATAWREFTQLPFVFALWAIRLPYWRALHAARHLRKAKQVGLAHRTAIARDAFEREYLHQHLSYELGPAQKQAIVRFSEILTQTGRIPAHHALKYV
jgi:predicted solute-binding protein